MPTAGPHRRHRGPSPPPLTPGAWEGSGTNWVPDFVMLVLKNGDFRPHPRGHGAQVLGQIQAAQSWYKPLEVGVPCQCPLTPTTKPIPQPPTITCPVSSPPDLDIHPDEPESLFGQWQLFGQNPARVWAACRVGFRAMRRSRAPSKSKAD